MGSTLKWPILADQVAQKTWKVLILKMCDILSLNILKKITI